MVREATAGQTPTDVDRRTDLEKREDAVTGFNDTIDTTTEQLGAGNGAFFEYRGRQFHYDNPTIRFDQRKPGKKFSISGPSLVGLQGHLASHSTVMFSIAEGGLPGIVRSVFEYGVDEPISERDLTTGEMGDLVQGMRAPTLQMKKLLALSSFTEPETAHFKATARPFGK